MRRMLATAVDSRAAREDARVEIPPPAALLERFAALPAAGPLLVALDD